MSIEKTIKNLRALAQWNEDNGDIDSASEKRQIANWLQELKERREKESRGIECRKPFMTVNVDKDMVQRMIDSTIESLYMVCDHCGYEIHPKRKEEES